MTPGQQLRPKLARCGITRSTNFGILLGINPCIQSRNGSVFIEGAKVCSGLFLRGLDQLPNKNSRSLFCLSGVHVLLSKKQTGFAFVLSLRLVSRSLFFSCCFFRVLFMLIEHCRRETVKIRVANICQLVNNYNNNLVQMSFPSICFFSSSLYLYS